MNFDYFLCIQDGVIVEEKDFSKHVGHDIVGEFFQVKRNKKKVFTGLIPKRIVNKAKEEQNVKIYFARKAKQKKKKLLEQQRFEKQVEDGAVIVNLLEMKI